MANPTLPKAPLILYFFADSVPTAKELSEVAKLRGRVQHRTAKFVNDDDRPEPCDGVAGTVPAPYKKVARADKALAAYDEAIEKLAKEIGDDKAPKVPKDSPNGDGKPPSWPGK